MTSLRIDKRYRGLPRLARFTGTDDPKTRDLYVGMCDAFYAAAATEWLLAIIEGRLSFAEAWTHYKPVSGRRLDVTRLPSPETVRRLWATDAEGREIGAITDWLEGADVRPTTRRNYVRDLRWLRRVAKPTATVADVPVLIVKARKEAITRNPQPRRAFNLLRTTAQAFLRDVVGKRHALYYALQDVAVLGEQRKPTSGLLPADARAVRDALARKSRAVADAWWALCTTGMRPAEYWQEDGAHWRAEDDRVVVWSTKTSTQRVLPRIDRVVTAAPAPAARSTVRDHLRELMHGTRRYRGTPWPRHLELYDARRSFRHWCEMARIPDSRAMAYRGAAPSRVDDRYRQHEVEPYLASDTATLRAYLGGEPGAGLRLVEGGA